VKEQQEKRFEVERVTLMKNYDNDLSSMIDSQKKQVDKCEQQQHEEHGRDFESPPSCPPR